MKQGNARVLYGSTDNSGVVPSEVVLQAAGAAASGAQVAPGATAAEATLAGAGAPAASATQAALATAASSTMSALNCVPGETLADVLELWDCRADKAVQGGKLVVRFENTDLLCQPNETPTPECYLGVVDTTEMDAIRGVAWLPSRSLSAAMGQQVINAFLDGKGALVFVLEDCFIRVSSCNGQLAASIGPLP